MKTKYFEVSCIEELIGEETEYDTEYDLGWNAAINGIMKHVPQIDAVQVVRCKDCKHWDGCFCALFDCVEELGSIAYDSSPEDFCSRGERRIKDEIL